MPYFAISHDIRGAYPATAPIAGTLSFEPYPLLRVDSAAASITEYTADDTIDVHTDLSDVMGNDTFEDVKLVLIEVIKTAATSSGTVVITGAGVFNKLAATTINAGSTNAAAASSGDCIYSYKLATSTPLDVTSGTNTIDLNFTSPVGFKVRLTIMVD